MQAPLNKFINQLAILATKERFLQSCYALKTLTLRSAELVENPELLYAFCAVYNANPQESKFYGLDAVVMQATDNITQKIIMNPKSLYYDALKLLNDLLKLNPHIAAASAQKHGLDICNAILNAHNIDPNKPISKINIPEDMLLKLKLACAICPSTKDPRLNIVRALIEVKEIEKINMTAQNSSNIQPLSLLIKQQNSLSNGLK